MDPNIEAMQARLTALSAAKAAAMGSTSASGVRTVHTFAVDPNAVHVDSPLPNISIMYKNRDMVADRVMPIVQVSKRSDKYFEYGASMAFDLAKTDIAGQLGQPSQASPTYSTSSYSVKDHALRDYVPIDTEANADSPLNPLIDATEHLNELLALAREVRVANKTFDLNNYGSNYAALAGTDRWDDPASDVVSKVYTAITACQMRPNKWVMGEQVFNALKNNPSLRQFLIGRATTQLGATPFFIDEDTLAKAFGFDEVVVGRAKYNSAVQGQTASYGWVWGKFSSFLYAPPSPGIRKASWGYTFRFGMLETRSWFDQSLGVRGANVVQVSHSDDEKNLETGGKTGYLYGTVIS